MAKRELAEQLERLPLNRVLRREVLAGAESLTKEQAEQKAAELKTALDRLPGLLEQLRPEGQEAGQEPMRSQSAARDRRARS